MEWYGFLHALLIRKPTGEKPTWREWVHGFSCDSTSCIVRVSSSLRWKANTEGA